MLFLSGLPRAGSTLLSAVLRQNPAVHADMSSPMANMVSGVQRSLSRAQEFSIGVNNETRVRVIRGLFESYYALEADKIVFDTNRVWTTKLGLLLSLFPDTRMVCCVRAIGEILQSFERIFHESQLELTAMFNFDPEINVYGRVDRIMVPTGVVGVALNGLKEAFYGPHSERLILVEYNRLASEPGPTIAALYDALGLSPFAHDFDRVDFAATAFDAAFGLPGLHTIRSKVGVAESIATLPPDLANMFRAPEFWTSTNGSSKAIRLV